MGAITLKGYHLIVLDDKDVIVSQILQGDTALSSTTSSSDPDYPCIAKVLFEKTEGLCSLQSMKQRPSKPLNFREWSQVNQNT
mmetsp:Transcript_1448/g.2011  ORF Transcript_1448/g.2011 Transcript_1448/m.2011 type:complete len:83 (-) Transcript_1448:161-409(-)